MGCTSSQPVLMPETPTGPPTGISIKTTSEYMPNGWMKWEKVKGVQDIKDGKRRTFSLKGGKLDQNWTLHFMESSQLWYLDCSIGAKYMIAGLEANKEKNEQPKCYVHEAGVPLSEGNWTTTAAPPPDCTSTPNIIEIGWIGTDTYGIEQYGVSATSAVHAAAAALSTNSEDIALVDAGTDDKLKWLKEAIAAAAARTGAKPDMKICIDKHSSGRLGGRAWADVPAADKIMVGGLEAVYASLKDFVVWLNQKNQGTEDLEEELAEADVFKLLEMCAIICAKAAEIRTGV